MKVGSDMRAFHDLLKHLSCTIVFTLRKDRTSAMSSSGRNTVGNDALDLRRRRLLIRWVSITIVTLKLKKPYMQINNANVVQIQERYLGRELLCCV